MPETRRGAAPSPYTPDAERAHPRPVVPLTPLEERVARLLASGKSAREIAGAIDRTRKTVEHIIERAAAKLPVTDLTPRDSLLVWAYWEYRDERNAA